MLLVSQLWLKLQRANLLNALYLMSFEIPEMICFRDFFMFGFGTVFYVTNEILQFYAAIEISSMLSDLL